MFEELFRFELRLGVDEARGVWLAEAAAIAAAAAANNDGLANNALAIAAIGLLLLFAGLGAALEE